MSAGCVVVSLEVVILTVPTAVVKLLSLLMMMVVDIAITFTDIVSAGLSEDVRRGLEVKLFRCGKKLLSGEIAEGKE